MRDVTARLKQLYRTEGADVLLMTSSGTGGLESAVQNVFSPGDEVYGSCDGSFAEFASVPADQLALKPWNLTFVQSAAAPISGSASARSPAAGQTSGGGRGCAGHQAGAATRCPSRTRRTRTS